MQQDASASNPCPTMLSMPARNADGQLLSKPVASNGVDAEGRGPGPEGLNRSRQGCRQGSGVSVALAGGDPPWDMLSLKAAITSAQPGVVENHQIFPRPLLMLHMLSSLVLMA